MKVLAKLIKEVPTEEGLTITLKIIPTEGQDIPKAVCHALVDMRGEDVEISLANSVADTSTGIQAIFSEVREQTSRILDMLENELVKADKVEA